MRFRLIIGAALLAVIGIASAVEKPPTWLVGKYHGHSRYMNADMDVSIASNGLVFADTVERNGKMNHESGRFHKNEVIIGRKVYGFEKSADGVVLINIWRSQDRLDLKRTQ